MTTRTKLSYLAAACLGAVVAAIVAVLELGNDGLYAMAGVVGLAVVVGSVLFDLAATKRLDQMVTYEPAALADQHEHRVVSPVVLDQLTLKVYVSRLEYSEFRRDPPIENPTHGASSVRPNGVKRSQQSLAGTVVHGVDPTPPLVPVAG